MKATFMAAESDLIKLYSTKILALAAGIPHTDRLENPTGSAKRRAPLCGSAVIVDVKIEEGVIVAFGQDVKACALGQAAASIVGAQIIGLNQSEIQKARDQMFSMLTQNGPVPDAPFEEFVVLEPARDYKNRHASILLCLDATLDAFTASGLAKSG